MRHTIVDWYTLKGGFRDKKADWTIGWLNLSQTLELIWDQTRPDQTRPDQTQPNLTGTY